MELDKLARKTEERQAQAVNWYLLLPMIFFVAVIPLIVHTKVVPLEGIASDFWNGGNITTDLFSYYKSRFIIICTIFSILVFCIQYITKRIFLISPFLYVPMLVMGLFIILSSLLAEHHDIAIFGFPDRYEGVLVLISYLIMCFTIANGLNLHKEYSIIFISLVVSASVVAVIGILQYMGWDIFTSSIGQFIVQSPGQVHAATGTVYSTLYNSNYVGSYMAMLLPLTFVLFVLSPKGYFKIVMGAVCVLMFTTLLSCYSRAGYLGGSIALLIAVFILKDLLKKEWKSVSAVFLSFLLVFLLINVKDDGMVIDSIKSIIPDREVIQVDTDHPKWNWHGRGESLPGYDKDNPVLIYRNIEGIYKGIKITINDNKMLVTGEGLPLAVRAEGLGLQFFDQDGNILNIVEDKRNKNYYIDDPRYEKYKLFIDENRLGIQYDSVRLNFLFLGEFFLPIDETTPPVEDINFNKNKLVLYSKEQELHVILDENELIFTDGDYHTILYEKYPFGIDYYVLNDERFIDYEVSVHKDMMQIKKGNKKLVLLMTDDGFKYINAAGKVYDDSRPVEAIGFKGFERAGSSRGYIWSRTIPLLKDTLIIGHGPDTFPIYFPQHEMEAKFRYLYNTSMIVDKPHNLYLQMGVNTGVISLIAFITLVFVYLYSGLKRYIIANYEGYQDVYGLAAWLAVIGYLITGFFNDSLVSVAPVFWGILGLGIGLLYRNQDNQKKV